MTERYQHLRREQFKRASYSEPADVTPDSSWLRFVAQAFVSSSIVAGVVWTQTPLLMSLWSISTTPPAKLATVERSVYYSGCNEAREAGAAPIYRGSPGYREEMDGDGDGIACERHW